MKKPKAKLETDLTEEQQAKLADWLLGGMQYYDAQELVRKEFGLPVSLRAFSHFWDKVCAPVLIQRRSKAARMAEAVTAQAGAEGKLIDAALLAALKQKAFEICIKPNVDPNEVQMVISQALKIRDQDLKQEQLGLAREKFQRETCKLFIEWYADQRAREIASSSESNASKLERLGQLMFGEEWK